MAESERVRADVYICQVFAANASYFSIFPY
jgi:hypothetical protein